MVSDSRGFLLILAPRKFPLWNISRIANRFLRFVLRRSSFYNSPPITLCIIIRFCAGVFSRLVIPPGAIFFFLHYIFASSFPFGHKVHYYRLSYSFLLFCFSRHSVLLSLRPTSLVHFSPHSLFSRLRFAFVSVNSIFSFSRGTANPSLLHRVFASRFFLLPTAVHLPPIAVFISFSVPRAKLLSTYRAYLYERIESCYGKYNV